MADDNGDNGKKDGSHLSERSQMGFGIAAMVCFTAIVITVLVLIFN